MPGKALTLDQTSCKNPLTDPGDNTRIFMVSAQNGVGLYTGPSMKYGLNKGEVLKVNCSTGEVPGIVRRQ
jgi:hypothetical protein